MVGKRVGQERKQKRKGGRSRGKRSRRRGREKSRAPNRIATRKREGGRDQGRLNEGKKVEHPTPPGPGCDLAMRFPDVSGSRVIQAFIAIKREENQRPGERPIDYLALVVKGLSSNPSQTVRRAEGVCQDIG
jgi:hypothetical protein